MNVSEIIRQQDAFQEPRGLNEENVGMVVFDRFMQEVYEAEADIVLGKYMEALIEISDVFIMAGAVALWLTKELNLKPEDVDNIIRWKMKQNEEKYNVRLFEEFSTQQAMMIARELWNKKHPKTPGSQFYGE
jgi:hypothetical protein